MKKDKEFEREDLAVDRDIQLDSDNKQQIVAYLETLFDANEKFNLQLDSEAGEWVNMYGIYNPLSDFLTVECVISKDNSSESFFYTPTTAESALIKELIAEKIKEVNPTTILMAVTACGSSSAMILMLRNHSSPRPGALRTA